MAPMARTGLSFAACVCALATVSTAQQCPEGYHECQGANECCDVDKSCECDHFCPMHPEVWWEDGCAVPKRNTEGGFVCPKGYRKCPNCCDVDKDCECDNKCGAAFPKGFDCSLTPGEDEYTTAKRNAVCPGGYTDCGKGKRCDIDPDCKLDDKCGERGQVPAGFPCTLPRRVNVDGSALSGGQIVAFAQPKGWNSAEADCVERGGHLASLHSAEDYNQLKKAVVDARIVGPIWVGGYEKDGENDWEWIDGSAMDRRFISTVDTGYAIETGPYTNFGGRDENTMAYCNRACSQKFNREWKAKDISKNVGLHDWGNRRHNWPQRTEGYACRLSPACALKEFQTMVLGLTAACCDEKGEDCAHGLPKKCPADCAAALAQFAQACRSHYSSVPGMTRTINSAVETCIREGATSQDQGSGGGGH